MIAGGQRGLLLLRDRQIPTRLARHLAALRGLERKAVELLGARRVAGVSHLLDRRREIRQAGQQAAMRIRGGQAADAGVRRRHLRRAVAGVHGREHVLERAHQRLVARAPALRAVKLLQIFGDGGRLLLGRAQRNRAGQVQIHLDHAHDAGHGQALLLGVRLKFDGLLGAVHHAGLVQADRGQQGRTAVGQLRQRPARRLFGQAVQRILERARQRGDGAAFVFVQFPFGHVDLHGHAFLAALQGDLHLDAAGRGDAQRHRVVRLKLGFRQGAGVGGG
ncbi:hypothetical protein D3C87_1368560 [compost metagenome]